MNHNGNNMIVYHPVLEINKKPLSLSVPNSPSIQVADNAKVHTSHKKHSFSFRFYYYRAFYPINGLITNPKG